MVFNSLFSMLEGLLPVGERKSIFLKHILASSNVGFVVGIEVHLDDIAHYVCNVSEDGFRHNFG